MCGDGIKNYQESLATQTGISGYSRGSRPSAPTLLSQSVAIHGEVDPRHPPYFHSQCYSRGSRHKLSQSVAIHGEVDPTVRGYSRGSRPSAPTLLSQSVAIHGEADPRHPPYFHSPWLFTGKQTSAPTLLSQSVAIHGEVDPRHPPYFHSPWLFTGKSTLGPSAPTLGTSFTVRGYSRGSRPSAPTLLSQSVAIHGEADPRHPPYFHSPWLFTGSRPSAPTLLSQSVAIHGEADPRHPAYFHSPWLFTGKQTLGTHPTFTVRGYSRGSRPSAPTLLSQSVAIHGEADPRHPPYFHSPWLFTGKQTSIQTSVYCG
ncbi:unnamed protein product [Mytilus edulis]|uniref:Uncharacterized protein n=1 Tax=Mytilus edulis TaxID=6550 RepID=A0A8S3UB69_MYTED|nr:unnamed protein product [Mytilus edulis]